MKKARIAMFIPDMGGGGAERIFTLLARGFWEKGHSIDLVLVRVEGAYLQEIPDACRIVDLGVRRVRQSIIPLVKYLRRERPDVLLTTREDAVIWAIIAKILSRTDVRLVLREANTLSVNCANLKLFGSFLYFASKLLYRYADVIVGVSQGVADDLKKHINVDGGKIVKINNPINVADIVAKSGEAVDLPWFQSGETPVVIGVGRLTKQKDFATLIRAFAIVRRKRAAKLLILGEGEERQNLQQLVTDLNLGDDVSLYGFVNNPFRYLAKAAVFTLSSRWEGFPNVLLQAMACGTPVVATDCPSGAAEILEDGKYGILVPMGDYGLLADAIIKTMDNPPTPEFLRQKCLSYDEKIIIEKYLDVLVPCAVE